MSLAPIAVLFAASVAQVFAMAFQSRNINSGNYAAAAVGSWFIGMFQTEVWSQVMEPGAGLAERLAYCAGGTVGVVGAMAAHKFFFNKRA